MGGRLSKRRLCGGRDEDERVISMPCLVFLSFFLLSFLLFIIDTLSIFLGGGGMGRFPPPLFVSKE